MATEFLESVTAAALGGELISESDSERILLDTDIEVLTLLNAAYTCLLYTSPSPRDRG